MTNINNDFNFTFHKTRCLGHLECRNQLCNYLVLNGTHNETAWIRNIIHNLNKECFTLGPPLCSPLLGLPSNFLISLGSSWNVNV
jgi:hypothetical protein